MPFFIEAFFFEKLKTLRTVPQVNSQYFILIKIRIAT